MLPGGLAPHGPNSSCIPKKISKGIWKEPPFQQDFSGKEFIFLGACLKGIVGKFCQCLFLAKTPKSPQSPKLFRMVFGPDSSRDDGGLNLAELQLVLRVFETVFVGNLAMFHLFSFQPRA